MSDQTCKASIDILYIFAAIMQGGLAAEDVQ